jgi:hypothetical protein
MNLQATSILSAILILLFLRCYSQKMEDIYLQEDSFKYKRTQLKNEFGNNKFFARGIELECLTALSFYPELKNTYIRFQFGKPLSTMVSKPKLKSVFNNRGEREYVITIKEPGISKNGFDWQELHFNALVGWIGHELAHIVHYSKKTNAGVLFTAIKYAFPCYRKKMERFTDQLAINHNLGEAIYEGTDYTLNHSGASNHYKKYLKKYYLLPDEIKSFIGAKKAYSVNFKKTLFVKWEDIAVVK